MSQPTPPSEPLITVGWITAAVTAVLAAAVAFGLDLTVEQTAAILGVVAVLAPLAVALVGRTRVFSPATVAETRSTAERLAVAAERLLDTETPRSDARETALRVALGDASGEVMSVVRR